MERRAGGSPGLLSPRSAGLAAVVNQPLAGVGDTPAAMVHNASLRRASMFNATGKWSVQ
jgi:hypothetical protein